MKITSETSISNFEFWSGAKSNAEELSLSQFEQIEFILEDLYPDGISDTTLNDLFWFEFETIKEWIGISDEEEKEV